MLPEIIKQLEVLDDEMAKHEQDCELCIEEPGNCMAWYDMIEQNNFLNLALIRTIKNTATPEGD